MNRFTPPPSGPPKREAHYRFSWWHCKNDIASHPRWRAIAAKTGVPVAHIVAVVVYLNGCANKAHRRGSVEDFKIFECAVTLELDPIEVQRIYDELVASVWIDQGCIVDWFEHNPDKADPTAAERKRRQRARERAERENRDGSEMSRVTGHEMSRSVTRDGHGVTSKNAVTSANVTRDVTVTDVTRPCHVDKIRKISSRETVSLEAVEKPELSTPHRIPITNDNGKSGAGERASASLADALARRIASKADSGDLTDEAAFSGMGIDPVLPSPIKPVARKEADYQSFLKNLLGSPVNGKGH